MICLLMVMRLSSIAVGAHEGIRLPIPGADRDGVLINTRFLRDVRLGKYVHSGEQLTTLRAFHLGLKFWFWGAGMWPLIAPGQQSGWELKSTWPV